MDLLTLRNTAVLALVATTTLLVPAVAPGLAVPAGLHDAVLRWPSGSARSSPSTGTACCGCCGGSS
jgi:hypothetical protein